METLARILEKRAEAIAPYEVYDCYSSSEELYREILKALETRDEAYIKSMLDYLAEE